MSYHKLILIASNVRSYNSDVMKKFVLLLLRQCLFSIFAERFELTNDVRGKLIFFLYVA